MNIIKATTPNKMAGMRDFCRFTLGAPQLGHILSLANNNLVQLPHFILNILCPLTALLSVL
jgi:hypothetical protein